jgi:hypothetical protein
VPLVFEVKYEASDVGLYEGRLTFHGPHSEVLSEFPFYFRVEAPQPLPTYPATAQHAIPLDSTLYPEGWALARLAVTVVPPEDRST